MLLAATMITGAWLQAQDVLAAPSGMGTPSMGWPASGEALGLSANVTAPPALEPISAPSSAARLRIPLAPAIVRNAPTWRTFDPWSPSGLVTARARAYAAASPRFTEPALRAPGAAQAVERVFDDPLEGWFRRPSGITPQALRDLEWRTHVELEQKGFDAEFGRNFFDRFAPMEHRSFRAAVDMSWTPPPRIDDPSRDLLPLGPVDPYYRDLLLEKKARSPILGTASDALAETDIVQDVRRELSDGDDPVSVGARTLLGERTDVPWGFGRLGLRGYASRLLRDPLNVIGVTYDVGPLDARIGGASTTVSVSQQLGSFRISARGTYDYEDGRAHPSIHVSRPLGRQTSLHLVAGYSADSFALPGNVPYFEDPRDRRSLGIVVYIDARF